MRQTPTSHSAASGKGGTIFLEWSSLPFSHQPHPWPQCKHFSQGGLVLLTLECSQSSPVPVVTLTCALSSQRILSLKDSWPGTEICWYLTRYGVFRSDGLLLQHLSWGTGALSDATGHFPLHPDACPRSRREPRGLLQILRDLSGRRAPFIVATLSPLSSQLLGLPFAPAYERLSCAGRPQHRPSNEQSPPSW